MQLEPREDRLLWNRQNPLQLSRNVSLPSRVVPLDVAYTSRNCFTRDRYYLFSRRQILRARPRDLFPHLTCIHSYYIPFRSFRTVFYFTFLFSLVSNFSDQIRRMKLCRNNRSVKHYFIGWDIRAISRTRRHSTRITWHYCWLLIIPNMLHRWRWIVSNYYHLGKFHISLKAKRERERYIYIESCYQKRAFSGNYIDIFSEKIYIYMLNENNTGWLLNFTHAAKKHCAIIATPDTLPRSATLVIGLLIL